MSKSSFICLALVLLLAACQSGPDLCKCAQLDSDAAVIGNLLAKQDPANPQSSGLKNKYKLVQQCARKYDGYNNIKRRARKECSSFKSTEGPAEKRVPKINETVFFGKAMEKLEEFNYPLGDIEFKNFISETTYTKGDIINRNSKGTIDTLNVIYDHSRLIGSGIQIQIDSSVYFQAFDFNHSYLENIVLSEVLDNTNEENSSSLTYYLLRVDLGHKIEFVGYVQGLNGGYTWTLTGLYFNPKEINISKNLKIEKTEDPCYLCP